MTTYRSRSRKIWHVRLTLTMLSVFLGSLTLPFFNVLNLAQVAHALASVDNSGHYTWINPNYITGTGTGTPAYYAVTYDDTGRQLILSSGQMVLARNQATCNNPVGVNGSNQASTSYLTVKPDPNKGDQGTSPLDAAFSHEVLIINNYTSATSVTYLSTAPGCTSDVQNTRTVPLTNTNAAQWTSDNPTPVITYLGYKFTYDKKGINNGTMALTGPTNINIGGNQSDCAPAPSLNVGDPNNTFLSATTSSLTYGSIIHDVGKSTCELQNIPVPLVANFMSTETTADWVDGSGAPANTDPHASLVLQHGGNADSGNGGTTGPLGTKTSGFSNIGLASITFAEANNKHPINGSAMTLTEYADNNGKTNNPSPCGNKIDQIVVDPYQTAPLATLTSYYVNGGSCQAATITVGLLSLYGGVPITSGNPTNPINTGTGCIDPNTDVLSWFLCPILTLEQNAASLINHAIINWLLFPVSTFFTAQTESVFNIFRNIAVAMLVIAALFMVISQAADLEIFSAHTVRKALPRIIIAAIVMSLAWPLLQFLIGFFNDLTQWSGNIIMSIANSGNNNAGSNFGTALGGVVDGVIAAVVGVGVFAVLGIGGILSLLFSMILLAGFGWVVLAIRIIVILLCVLLAEPAIASFVTPGTEKFGKFWRETFTTALVIGPFISLFIGAGFAVASIMARTGIGYYEAGAAVVLIAPYPLIFVAFRIVGGVVGRVADWAQGTHQQTLGGVLQRQRQRVAGENLGRLGRGTRFSNNFIGSRANMLTSGATAAAHLRFGARARARIGLEQAASAKTAANNPLVQQLQYDDDANAALFASGGSGDIGGGSRAAYRRLTASVASGGAGWTAARARAAINRANAVGFTPENFYASVQTLAANKARALPGGQGGINFVNQLLDDATRGNAPLREQLAGGFGFAARAAGATHLAAVMNEGAPQTLRSSWGMASMQQLGASTDGAIKSFLDDAVDRYSGAGERAGRVVYANAAQRNQDRYQAGIQLLEAQNLLPYVSPGGQAHIGAALNSIGFNDPDRRAIPAEQRIADGSAALGIAGIVGPSGTALNGNALRSYARVYDSTVPQGVTGQQGNQGNSDRRLKKQITQLCTLTSGIKLYRFTYIWGGPAYVGVMAQDLLKTHPEAVIRNENGYYSVDYGMLGMKMAEFSAWQNDPSTIYLNEFVTR